MSVIRLIDSYTKESVNYEETTTWYDGTPMDDTKVDNVIYRKKEDKYYKRIIQDGIINVRWFGAKGDGITDDASNISNAIAVFSVNGGVLLFPPGTYVIGTNITFPSNVTAEFSNGAKLSINTGITVTINGPINAGLYQIFSGEGTVSGSIKVPFVVPEWWGALGDGICDDTGALTQALAFAPSFELRLSSNKTYRFTRKLTPLGKIRGAGRSGTTLLADGCDGFEGGAPSNFELSDLTLRQSVPGTNVGINIYSAAKHWYSIKNVTIDGFNTNFYSGASWNGYLENVISRNAGTYAYRLGVYNSYEPNVTTFQSCYAYNSPYGFYGIGPFYAICLYNCGSERNGYNVWFENIKGLDINGLYEEAATTLGVKLINCLGTLCNSKVDKVEMVNSKMSVFGNMPFNILWLTLDGGSYDVKLNHPTDYRDIKFPITDGTYVKPGSPNILGKAQSLYGIGWSKRYNDIVGSYVTGVTSSVFNNKDTVWRLDRIGTADGSAAGYALTSSASPILSFTDKIFLVARIRGNGKWSFINALPDSGRTTQFIDITLSSSWQLLMISFTASEDKCIGVREINKDTSAYIEFDYIALGNGHFPVYGSDMNFGESFTNAAPNNGYWVKGDKTFNINPTAGAPIGWICTASGTPGTWETFGAISA